MAAALNSWCYTENNKFRPATDLICDLVDIVSKNGRLLLNVGPKADGTFSDEDAKILKEIGAWLKVNGEAIYDTKVSGEPTGKDQQKSWKGSLRMGSRRILHLKISVLRQRMGICTQ